MEGIIALKICRARRPKAGEIFRATMLRLARALSAIRLIKQGRGKGGYRDGPPYPIALSRLLFLRPEWLDAGGDRLSVPSPHGIALIGVHQGRKYLVA